MKLRNIFTALLAALTLTVSCEDEKVAYLDEIKVSQSYVAIDAAGGSTEITLNAKDEWSFSGVPEWLKVEPASGDAGKDITVTFSATAAKATKEAMLYLNCGSKSQIINVIQMTEKVDLPISTYKQIAAGQDVLFIVLRELATISITQSMVTGTSSMLPVTLLSMVLWIRMVQPRTSRVSVSRLVTSLL